MMEMKNDKKRFTLGLRLKVLLLTICGIVSIIVGTSKLGHAANITEMNDEDYLNLTLSLERVYLDGEISIEYVHETISAIEDLTNKYDNWQFINVQNNVIVLQQYIDDISPLLKANGYFGISPDGILATYYGKPNIDNVIQSFFQLDVEKLESTHHERLKLGIPIKDRANYVKVLEAYGQYGTPVEH